MFHLFFNGLPSFSLGCTYVLFVLLGWVRAAKYLPSRITFGFCLVYVIE